MLDLIIFHAMEVFGAIVMNPWLLGIATLIGGWAAIEYFWGKYATNKKNKSTKNQLVVKPETNQLPKKLPKKSPNAPVTKPTEKGDHQKGKNMTINRPYVSNYKHDVFVSYACADNENGWTTELIKSFQKTLEQELGYTNSCSLWMDRESRDESPVTFKTLEKLKNCATFFLVLSSNYSASQRCCSELETFLTTTAKEDRRVFIVERDLVSDDDRPEKIKDLTGIKFWKMDNAGKSCTLPIPKSTSKETEYYQKLDDIARPLAGKLKALKSEQVLKQVKGNYEEAIAYQQEGKPKPTVLMARQCAEAICHHIFTQTISPKPGKLMLDNCLQKLKDVLPESILISLQNIQRHGNFGIHYQEGVEITMEDTLSCMTDLNKVFKWYSKEYHQQSVEARATIFLGEVTPELATQRDELKRFLEQQDVRILPDRAYVNVQQSLDEDLSKCNLFVQLLNDNSNNIEHYQQFQYKCAKAAKLRDCRWYAQDLRNITDSIQRHSLEVQMTIRFDEFKKDLLSAILAKPEETPKRNVENTLVFVNAASADMEVARHIEDFLGKEQINCRLPLSPSSEPADIRKNLEDNLLNCDAVIVPYDNTSVNEVCEKIRHCRKMQADRDKPLKIIAVCDKPSINKPSLRDIMTLPNLQIFDCPELHVDTCLPSFIQELQA